MDSITIFGLVNSLLQYRVIIATFIILIPVISFVVGILLKRAGKTKACAWFLSIIIYITLIPGICILIIVLYLFFFAGTNLVTQLDIILYFGPIISMIATLIIVSRIMPFRDIPGFDRLSGLMLVTGISFAIILFLYRLRFFIGFFASLEILILIFAAIFVLLKIGIEKIFKRKEKR